MDFFSYLMKQNLSKDLKEKIKEEHKKYEKEEKKKNDAMLDEDDDYEVY